MCVLYFSSLISEKKKLIDTEKPSVCWKMYIKSCWNSNKVGKWNTKTCAFAFTSGWLAYFFADDLVYLAEFQSFFVNNTFEIDRIVLLCFVNRKKQVKNNGMEVILNDFRIFNYMWLSTAQYQQQPATHTVCFSLMQSKRSIFSSSVFFFEFSPQNAKHEIQIHIGSHKNDEWN